MKPLSDVAETRGYDLVHPTKVYAAFDRHADLAQYGFMQVRPGFYGCTVDKDITRIVKLQKLKGAKFTLWWGLSLAYMPHEWSRGVHWHSTLKSARPDLFDYPCNDRQDAGDLYNSASDLQISANQGEAYVYQTCQKMWTISFAANI
jgi:hypothetical protein